MGVPDDMAAAPLVRNAFSCANMHSINKASFEVFVKKKFDFFKCLSFGDYLGFCRRTVANKWCCGGSSDHCLTIGF